MKLRVSQLCLSLDFISSTLYNVITLIACTTDACENAQKPLQSKKPQKGYGPCENISTFQESLSTNLVFFYDVYNKLPNRSQLLCRAVILAVVLPLLVTGYNLCMEFSKPQN